MVPNAGCMNGPLLVDVRVAQQENCFPVIPAGRCHHALMLCPTARPVCLCSAGRSYCRPWTEVALFCFDMNSSPESPIEKIAAWRTALGELAALEQALGDALVDYARTREEPPRYLIIDAERKRDQVRALFDVAMESLDAQSSARTGLTNFGSLS